MKRNILFILICWFALSSSAQEKEEDFQTFRKNMLEGFQGFRKNILDDYAKFLNGIWKDYEMLAGRKAKPLPKPDVQPQKKDNEPPPAPRPVVPDKVNPAEPVVEDIPNTPKPTVVPPTTIVSFDWCGMTLQLPDAKIAGNLNDLSKESLVVYLETLNNSQLNKDVVPQMINIAKASNFNDWCAFMLVESYVKKIKANANCNTRNFICWYILASIGFDARLSINGKNLFFLIPFKQIVYAHSYIKINDIPYYIWGEGKIDDNGGLYTPEVPDDTGFAVNLVLTKALNIPYKAKKFTHTFSGRTLSVEVNENLIQVMKQFPQIPIPAYAMSKGDGKARNQVLTQMKQFIQNMDELEAANFILQFIQSFDYATDDEQFGYEKPFFVEEILYYPKCDCEDRSIFYHFLITQLLGNSVHLVSYPNHECTAVHFSQDLNADSYRYDGKQYVICDPTYIGATIGMCMPDFKDVKPEIDLIK